MSRRNKVAVSVEALGTVNLPRSRADAYEAVRAHPGCTARELERITGTRLIQRRLTELEEAGLLLTGEPRTCCVTSRRAHVYRVSPNPAAAPYKRRETVADVKRQLAACKEEVRYLAARLQEEREANGPEARRMAVQALLELISDGLRSGLTTSQIANALESNVYFAPHLPAMMARAKA